MCNWIIKGKLATSPQPSKREIPSLSEEFDAVIILVQPYELTYDPILWKKHGVEVLHTPVPDFGAPNLLQLYKIVSWIADKIRNKKKVLVHCHGGIGRSRTIAAAYLMLFGKKSFEEACDEVAKDILLFPESWKQERTPQLFERLISVAQSREIETVLQLAEKYNYGRGIEHAARVAELSIMLFDGLKAQLDLKEDTLRHLIFASVLHDIGVQVDEAHHHIHTFNLIEKEKETIKGVLSSSDVEIIKWVALYHRTKAGDPRENNKLQEEFKDTIVKLSALLRISDALDYSQEQNVEEISVQPLENKIIITLYGRNCEIEMERAYQKSTLACQILNREIEFKYGGYAST